jgi:iron complex transport system substrate-binding protein
MRVVSFLPSATEIVAALGHADAIVGISHECDFPPVVKSRAVVTSSSIASAATPGDVDAQVRALVESGRPMYDVREDRVRELAPDLLVTQVVCDVCAVSENEVRAVAARLEPAPKVVTLGATTLDGIFDDVRRVAIALGDEARADVLLAEARSRMRIVHETLKAARAPRPRVAVIEWTEPVFAAGHWVPEMIHRAGGEDVLAKPGEHSTKRTHDALRDARPDIVIVAPCGFDLERATDDATRVLEQPEWRWTADVQVWAVDANAYLSRPGPRVVDGIDVLARIFNPQLFGHPAPDSARRLR